MTSRAGTRTATALHSAIRPAQPSVTPMTLRVPPALEDDRTAVDRMAHGDASAVANLYDRHARAVYSLALRMLADAAEAEDVVQDVFTQAWRQAGLYDPARAPVIGWLLVITRARTLDRLRARRSRIALAGVGPDPATVVDSSPRPDAQAIGLEQGTRVRAALASLSVAQREAIELAYYKGLSQSDIAERLQEPLGTIKTRIRSGLIRLRELLHGSLGEQTP
jgi:RNA polymerase sigma-70 factor, ECF subfamily